MNDDTILVKLAQLGTKPDSPFVLLCDETTGANPGLHC